MNLHTARSGEASALIPSNPFESAMRSASTEVYLSMARAGLGTQFNPLPVNEHGESLAAHMMQNPHPLLAKTLADFGLSFLVECEWPEQMSRVSFSMRQLGFSSAPLAAIALASDWRGLEAFWRDLSSRDLVSIATKALPLACYLGSETAVKTLLDAGADPNMLVPGGNPVASLALSPQTLSLLIDAGADLRIPLVDSPEPSCATAMDLLLRDKSLRPDSKELRALVLRWSLDHPLPEALPGENMARMAFEALEKKNKDVARTCITALGAGAGAHRNASGQTLLTCALSASNYIEANRLLSFGMDPYEQDASGASAWALLIAAKSKNTRPYGRGSISSSDCDRISNLLDSLQSKRKYRSIPWGRRSKNGHLLIESLLGCVPLPDIPDLLNKSLNEGFSMDATLSSGLSVASAILLLSSFTNMGRFSDGLLEKSLLKLIEMSPPLAAPIQELSGYCEAFFTIQQQIVTGTREPSQPRSAFSELWSCVPHNPQVLTWSSRIAAPRAVDENAAVDKLRRMHADMIYAGVEARAELGLQHGFEKVPASGLVVDDATQLLLAYEKKAMSCAAPKPTMSSKPPRL